MMNNYDSEYKQSDSAILQDQVDTDFTNIKNLRARHARRVKRNGRKAISHVQSQAEVTVDPKSNLNIHINRTTNETIHKTAWKGLRRPKSKVSKKQSFQHEDQTSKNKLIQTKISEYFYIKKFEETKDIEVATDVGMELSDLFRLDANTIARRKINQLITLGLLTVENLTMLTSQIKPRKCSIYYTAAEKRRYERIRKELKQFNRNHVKRMKNFLKFFMKRIAAKEGVNDNRFITKVFNLMMSSPVCEKYVATDFDQAFLYLYQNKDKLDQMNVSLVLENMHGNEAFDAIGYDAMHKYADDKRHVEAQIKQENTKQVELRAMNTPNNIKVPDWAILILFIIKLITFAGMINANETNNGLYGGAHPGDKEKNYRKKPHQEDVLKERKNGPCNDVGKFIPEIMVEIHEGITVCRRCKCIVKLHSKEVGYKHLSYNLLQKQQMFEQHKSQLLPVVNTATTNSTTTSSLAAATMPSATSAIEMSSIQIVDKPAPTLQKLENSPEEPHEDDDDDFEITSEQTKEDKHKREKLSGDQLEELDDTGELLSRIVKQHTGLTVPADLITTTRTSMQPRNNGPLSLQVSDRIYSEYDVDILTYPYIRKYINIFTTILVTILALVTIVLSAYLLSDFYELFKLNWFEHDVEIISLDIFCFVMLVAVFVVFLLENDRHVLSFMYNYFHNTIRIPLLVIPIGSVLATLIDNEFKIGNIMLYFCSSVNVVFTIMFLKLYFKQVYYKLVYQTDQGYVQVMSHMVVSVWVDYPLGATVDDIRKTVKRKMESVPGFPLADLKTIQYYEGTISAIIAILDRQNVPPFQ